MLKSELKMLEEIEKKENSVVHMRLKKRLVVEVVECCGLDGFGLSGSPNIQVQFRDLN